MAKFDDTDIAILNLIQQDSRLTIKEMAKRLNLSTTPIFERLKKLEKSGVIKKYVVLLDPKKIGKKLTAFIHISIIDHSKKGLDEFVNQINSFTEVMECHHVTGDSDFLLKVVVEDIDRYNQFITEKLSITPNIGKIKTSFSLASRKETTAYQIELKNLKK